MTYDCDVLVIGAGIHGAGVAQAAAAAGLSVRVLEQHGIAAGTSSRSSKLIHGGLRYLEHGKFRLVREALREREILLRLAPDLVRLVPFHLPIYRSTARRPATIRLGLSLYALLGGLRANARFTELPQQRWDALDGLTQVGLQRVYRYYDAQTDDAALTRAVMRSAQALGAQLLCPVRFLAARANRDGVEVDVDDAAGTTVRARVLVNAAGPWVNEVLTHVSPLPTPRALALVQGAHLVLGQQLTQGAYYLEAPPDRRAVFALPWRGGMLLGTTETAYTGEPSAVRPLPDEIAYLRATLRHYFPHVPDDPQDAFAGLRVLPAVSTAPFYRSRETLLHVDTLVQPRVLSIYGGKLTTYRLTAQRVLTRLRGVLPQRRARADTARLALKPE